MDDGVQGIVPVLSAISGEEGEVGGFLGQRTIHFGQGPGGDVPHVLWRGVVQGGNSGSEGALGQYHDVCLACEAKRKGPALVDRWRIQYMCVLCKRLVRLPMSFKYIVQSAYCPTHYSAAVDAGDLKGPAVFARGASVGDALMVEEEGKSNFVDHAMLTQDRSGPSGLAKGLGKKPQYE
jgi:hypothetical protein